MTKHHKVSSNRSLLSAEKSFSVNKACHEQTQYSRLAYRSGIMVCFTLNENHAHFASVLTNTVGATNTSLLCQQKITKNPVIYPGYGKTLETSLVSTPIKCSIKQHTAFDNLA